MKYYVLDDYREKKLNKKKLAKTIVIVLLIITIIVLSAFYIGEEHFREWIDIYIFRKGVNENTGPIIEYDTDSNTYLYSYNGKMLILNKNRLLNYSKEGKQEYEISVNISNPIFASAGEYLCLAEKGGNKLYLISGQNIMWQQDMEGKISRASVNKNGYVSVILTGTTDKTVVVTFSNEGRKISTAYLSATYAVDTDISEDNKYIAIAEINSSGTLLQSNIKVISLEEQKIVYTYKADSKQMITGIKYQDKNKIVCMFDDGIIQITDFTPEEKTGFDSDTLFSDISLNNYYLKATKKSTGLFATETEIEMTNLQTSSVGLYKVKGIPKEIKAYQDVVAVNLGTEVHFIHVSGWLIKKYISSKEIKEVILSQNLAGIVYKDKIELVSL